MQLYPRNSGGSRRLMLVVPTATRIIEGIERLLSCSNTVI